MANVKMLTKDLFISTTNQTKFNNLHSVPSQVKSCVVCDEDFVLNLSFARQLKTVIPQTFPSVHGFQIEILFLKSPLEECFL